MFVTKAIKQRQLLTIKSITDIIENLDEEESEETVDIELDLGQLEDDI